MILFGRNILREALRAKAALSKIYYETEAAKRFAQSLSGLRHADVEWISGIPAAFRHQAHQGIVFETSHSFYRPYSDLSLKQYPLVILCNHVQDIHNFGSIARCAAAFRGGLMIHEEDQSAELTPAAVKSSAGLAFHIQFAKVKSLVDPLKELSRRGFSIVGLDSDRQAISLYEWTPTFPIALILGSESSGIDADIKFFCRESVRIPMEKVAESLNVSHAAAIAMNWIYRNF